MRDHPQPKALRSASDNCNAVMHRVTFLAHLINVELLRICHNEMDGKKAAGIGKVTRKFNQFDKLHKYQYHFEERKRLVPKTISEGPSSIEYRAG